MSDFFSQYIEGLQSRIVRRIYVVCITLGQPNRSILKRNGRKSRTAAVHNWRVHFWEEKKANQQDSSNSGDKLCRSEKEIETANPSLAIKWEAKQGCMKNFFLPDPTQAHGSELWEGLCFTYYRKKTSLFFHFNRWFQNWQNLADWMYCHQLSNLQKERSNELSTRVLFG